MRVDLVLLGVGALVVGFEALVPSPSDAPRREQRVAQIAGPLPTSALNPRLGSAPPGGRPGSRVDPVGIVRRPDGTVIADPAGRLPPMNEGRLGAPPARAVPPAAVGAVPPAAGSVPPPAAGAVQPPPGPNVPPLVPSR
jgi:hypothetical protein